MESFVQFLRFDIVGQLLVPSAVRPFGTSCSYTMRCRWSMFGFWPSVTQTTFVNACRTLVE